MAKESKPFIFVVDDDPKIVRLVADVLESDEWIVETHSLAGDFLESYRAERRGCLLLDIQMPGLSGPELQRELLARKVDIPIIFLTATADVPTTIEIMKQGALDVLQKPFDPEGLVAAVRNALARDASAAQERTRREAVRSLLALLTPRERQVMELVVAGKANKQIAGQLKISERTVEIHRGRVMKKMEANSVADLVLLSAIAGGAIPNLPQ